MRRVHSRSTFQSFRSSRIRATSGPVRLTFVEGEGVSVAFAIGRKVGTAVTRNRIRRQLRAICEEIVSEMRDGAYLVVASSEVAELSYGELKTTMTEAVATISKRVSK